MSTNTNREGTLRRVAPNVFEALYDRSTGLIANVNAFVPFDEKWKELLLLATFATHRSLRGLGEHVKRARAAGASQEEIYGAILVILPVVGIPDTNLALEQAEATLRELAQE